MRPLPTYLCVDADGIEMIFNRYPDRVDNSWDSPSEDECYADRVYLPAGTILLLIGYELSWEDEPVEIKGVN